MICLLDDGRCLVFICSPLLMAIFVLHFILFAEGRLSFLFSVDVWFVLSFVLVHVNAWGVGPSGSPHFVLLGLANNCVDICVWHGLLPCFLYVLNAVHRSCYYIPPPFVSFVCRFSIFLGSLCLEHRLDCNANSPRAKQRLAPPSNGRGEISNPVNQGG